MRDPGVRLLGFQGYARLPESNLLVFEHRCGSTVSVRTSRLRHLLPAEGEAEGEAEGKAEGKAEGEAEVGAGGGAGDAEGMAEAPSLRGTAECPGHCRSLADMGACVKRCAHARERALIRIVREIRGEAQRVSRRGRGRRRRRHGVACGNGPGEGGSEHLAGGAAAPCGRAWAGRVARESGK